MIAALSIALGVVSLLSAAAIVHLRKERDDARRAAESWQLECVKPVSWKRQAREHRAWGQPVGSA